MMLGEQVDFLKQLAKALSVQFGHNCEVTIHDLTEGTEQTIVAIENGHVTGRRIGDSASPIVLRALKSKDEELEDNLGYLTRTQDGRLLKSTSVYRRDEQGMATAILCINYDITELSHVGSIIDRFISTSSDKQENSGIDSIFSNVNDLLDTLIEESVQHVGKPVALMDKDDKVKAVRFLDEKGAFLIKKAGDRVTKYYDISKYTLYNYLDLENNGKN
jgi:predicted transcriptional regulator YheO